MTETPAKPRTRAQIQSGYRYMLLALAASYFYAVALVAWCVFSWHLTSAPIGLLALAVYAVPMAYCVRYFTRQRDDGLAELRQRELAGDFSSEASQSPLGFKPA